MFQVVCIDLCCPHGETLLANPDYDYSDYTQPAFTCQQEEQAGTFRLAVKAEWRTPVSLRQKGPL